MPRTPHKSARRQGQMKVKELQGCLGHFYSDKTCAFIPMQQIQMKYRKSLAEKQIIYADIQEGGKRLLNEKVYVLKVSSNRQKLDELSYYYVPPTGPIRNPAQCFDFSRKAAILDEFFGTRTTSRPAPACARREKVVKRLTNKLKQRKADSAGQVVNVVSKRKKKHKKEKPKKWSQMSLQEKRADTQRPLDRGIIAGGFAEHCLSQEVLGLHLLAPKAMDHKSGQGIKQVPGEGTYTPEQLVSGYKEPEFETLSPNRAAASLRNYDRLRVHYDHIRTAIKERAKILRADIKDSDEQEDTSHGVSDADYAEQLARTVIADPSFTRFHLLPEDTEEILPRKEAAALIKASSFELEWPPLTQPQPSEDDVEGTTLAEARAVVAEAARAAVHETSHSTIDPQTLNEVMERIRSLESQQPPVTPERIIREEILPEAKQPDDDEIVGFNVTKGRLKDLLRCSFKETTFGCAMMKDIFTCQERLVEANVSGRQHRSV